MRQPSGAFRAAIFALPCAFVCSQFVACSDGEDGDAAVATAAEPDGPSADAAASPSTGAEAAEAGATAEPATGAAAEAGADAGAADGDEAAGNEPEGASAGEEVGPPPAPADYGLFKMPKEPPPIAELTGHGLAGYGVVAVYGQPNMESTKLGFLRLGRRLRVGPKISSPDCPKGWHELETGGFACASKGLVYDASKEPYMTDPPPPPAVDKPFPYEWAYVKKWNSPMWWRAASGEERKRAQLERAKLEAARTGEPLENHLPAWAKPKPAPKPAAPAAPAGEGGDDEGLGALPSVEDPAPKPEPEPAPEPVEDAPPANVDDGAEAAEEAEPPPPLPLSPEHPWLEKGYFISLAGKVRDAGHTFWRTARGGYVSTDDAWTYEPKDFQGQALDAEEMQFPVGYVMEKTTKVYELGEDDKLKVVGKKERRDFVNLQEETEINGKAYMMTADGQLLRKDALRMPDLQPIPEGLEPYDRWIDVDLRKQILVAYEGNRPVYVTLVSTGKKGTQDEPFETPTGRWRIYSKQVTSNMDGTTASDGNYAIQDVPWVMYFDGSYALHGAFWHRSFGYVRSHGCVNLGPSDARWLFFWTTPFVPDTWHGAHSSDENLGTTVVIRRSEDAPDEEEN